ncbi:MAG TPA: hypothetical protein VJ827_00540 [Rubrobacter sp.]|nr:hypothetical protein [Rubrobacter sp.]
MTRDHIQPLADIGRRVLRTVRYLTTPPVPDQPLESYETLVRDPLVALSGLCGGLLEGLAAAPVAAEPEILPNEPWSRFVPAPNRGPASPAFSRAGATRVPAVRRDEATYSRMESQAAEWPGTAGTDFDFTSPFEEVRRSIDDPAPFPDEPGSRGPGEAAASREPGGSVSHTESPAAAPPRPAIDGDDLSIRQTARRTPLPRDTKRPVEPFPTEQPPTDEHRTGSEGEPSPEEHSSKTLPPARQEWPEIRHTESPSDTRASALPLRAENGLARGAGDSEIPVRRSRLTGSTERLAAMLRSHVAQPEPVTRVDEKENQEGEDIFSGRQGDDERGASRIVGQPAARTAGPAGVEEIMERLADELETEFVRTYGSSGG